MLWFQFLFASFLIVLAGIRLTRYADLLSDRLHLGKVWIGVVLLGFVTSLPELVASLAAVVSLHAPNLAVGNMLGSNSFNVVLIALMDLSYRPDSVTNRIANNRTNTLPAVWASLLTMLVLTEILVSGQMPVPAFGPVSAGTLVLLAAYLFGMRRLYEGQKTLSGGRMAGGTDDAGTAGDLGKIYLNLALSALLVTAAAVWLANIADRIAEVTGLGRTFVGTVFLALVTSLPEMVVTVSAVRLGSLDMAVGNIFGSNMTNMCILGITALAARGAPLLSSVSPSQIIAGVASLVMTAVALLGVRQNTKRTLFRMAWDSWALIAIFLISLRLVYQFTR